MVKRGWKRGVNKRGQSPNSKAALITLDKRSKEEVREIASKGGKASVEARRKYRNMEEFFEIALQNRIPFENLDEPNKAHYTKLARAAGCNPEDMTHLEAVGGAQMIRAEGGNPLAFVNVTKRSDGFPPLLPAGAQLNQTINITPELSASDRILNDILAFCSKAGITCPVFSTKRYIVAEGGRGGGKSENIGARYVLWYAMNAKNTKVLCGREIQNSIKESVKAVLERLIKQYRCEAEFHITDSQIVNKNTGTPIIFLGLKAATAPNTDTMKSLDNVSLAWIEEAQTVGQRTLDKLSPTIRVDKVEMLDGSFRSSQLIFTYNRTLDSDPVHVTLVESKRPDVLHININYWDNPFLPQVLKDEAELLKATNYGSWQHIWGGLPAVFFESSLWPDELLLKMRLAVSFDRSNYARVVVSCDPATTDNEFSNEYGIGVEGLTLGGEGHIIKDDSGRYSPNEFAQKVIANYYAYQADAIVVETNAGGDFIKSTILSLDPKVVIIEVRAHRDKIMRAVPVANLCQMGKIFLICGGSPKLENQMKRMTQKGFMGAPGESPDRVEAMEWGFYNLFNLSEMDTTELIFKRTMFRNLKDYEAIPDYTDVAYLGFDGSLYGLFICDWVNEILPDRETKMRLMVKDYEKGPKENVLQKLTELLNANKIKELNIPDDVTGQPILNSLSGKYVGVKSIEVENYIKKPIIERVTQILPYVQGGQLCVIEALPQKVYNSNQGDLFTKELCEYNPEQVVDRPLLSAVCNCLMLENDLRGG